MSQRRVGACAVGLAAGVVSIAMTGGEPAMGGCTITWDGGAGTMSWHTAANWDTNVVPGPADDVCIPAGANVLYVTGASTIASLACAGNLTASGGTLMLAGASAIDGSLIVSGIVGGAG